MHHAHDPSLAISEPDQMPLAAFFLWSTDDSSQMNLKIKRILSIFVDYVSIDFGQEKVEIIAVNLVNGIDDERWRKLSIGFWLQRLVNLVFHCMNLSERQPRQHEITYPLIESQTKLFCNEIDKAIESECILL